MQQATVYTPTFSPSGVPSVPPKKDTVETLLMGCLPKVGAIFFTDEVRLKGVPKQQVRFALAKLALEGVVFRLAWGIYIRPVLGEHSQKALLPSPERIAFALAEKSHLQIIPSGERAARRVGLLGKDAEWTDKWTDEWFVLGAPREIKLYNGHVIRFLMTKETRMFAFKDDRMRDLSNGLRHLGKFNVGDFEKDAVRVWLKRIPEENFREDLELCPEWVREVLEECWEKRGGRKKTKMAAESAERKGGEEGNIAVEVVEAGGKNVTK